MDVGIRKKATRSRGVILDRLVELLRRHNPERLEAFWDHVKDQADEDTSADRETKPGQRPESDT